MTPREELVTLAMALAAYYGYYLAPTPQARGWVYYVACGALMAWCGLLMRRRTASQVGVAGCAMLVAEGGQQAVCGSASFGLGLTGQDVCVRWLGADAYRVAASLALSALVVVIWQQNRQR